MTIRVSVLGPVRAWRASDELALGPPQQRTVFALLVLADGRQVSTADLIDALWVSKPPPSATNVLQTYVKRLRRLLEPDRPSRHDSSLLLTTGQGYLLDPASIDLELTRFRSLVTSARAAHRAGEHGEALSAVQQAMDLWAGPPLDNVPLLADSHWSRRLDRERCTALDLLAGAAIAQGRAAEALPLVEAAAAKHDLDERLQTRVIQLYGALGRRSDAFVAYRRARRRLADELGVDPGADLEAAHDELLRDQAAPPSSAPGLATAVPAQLPARGGQLIGRSMEAARLLDLLHPDPDGRRGGLAAVSGMGGMGKTTLAVHVAHHVARDFPDGQLYADLGGEGPSTADPSAVLARFLLSLGVDGSVIPEPVDERAALYRTRLANRRVLVVLDNAGNDAQIEPLLPGAASCAVLITGRRRLTRTCGSAVVHLDVLGDDAAIGLLSGLVGHGRTRPDLPAAREIARLCDGIPLALSVASARLAARPHLGLARFADALRDERRRLDRLDAGDHGVRATFGVSYLALTEPARRAFRRLGTLPVTGVAGWVVAALLDCTTAEADDLLGTLVEAQLVTANDHDQLGEPRYRMHDLVRLYATDRAHAEDPADERRRAAARAVGGWLTLAEHADHALPSRTFARNRGQPLGWQPPDDIVQLARTDPLTWFETERANLSSVILFACAQDQVELAWRIADACAAFYEARDLYDDWRRTHHACIERLDDDQGRAVLSRSLAHLASVPCIAPAAMRQHAHTALRLFSRLDDPVGQADALLLSATAQLGDGDPAGALVRLDDAMALASRDQYLAGQVRIHVALGVAHRDQGHLKAAAAHFERALELTADGGMLRPRLLALRFLGLIRFQLGHPEESEVLLLEGIELASHAGARMDELILLAVLGETRAIAGRPGGKDALQRALAISEAIGSAFGRAQVERGLATLDLAERRPLQARERLVAALPTITRSGTVLVHALTLRLLARAHAALGDQRAALGALGEAREVFVRLGNAGQVDAVDGQIAAVRASRVGSG